MSTEYQKLKKQLSEIRCEKCNGLGEINDAEPGDIGYNTWKCPSCNGTGFKDGTINYLVQLKG